MAYTAESKKLCLDMVVKGYSARAIQDATGFSLGQVVGFARRAGHRIGKIRASTSQPLPAMPTVKIERPNPVQKHRSKVPIAPIQTRYRNGVVLSGSAAPVTIMELTRNHCRWMLDDTHYCGALTIIRNGKLTSYCAGHYTIMFKPPIQKNR